MALLPGDTLKAVSATNQTTYWAGSSYFSLRVLFTPTVDMFIDAIEVQRSQGANQGGTVGLATPFQNTSTIPWLVGLRGKQVKGNHTLAEYQATNPMRVQLEDTFLLKAGVQYAFVWLASAGPAVAPSVPVSGNVNMTTGGTYYSFSNPPQFESNQPSYAAMFNLIESVNARPNLVSVPPGAYGTRAYGDGAPIVERGPVAMSATVNAGSTVAFGMGAPQVATKQGDIVLLPSTPQPQDITIEPAEGPNTLASGPHGVATMSINTWQSHSISSRSTGVATHTANTGVRYRSLGTSIGVGGTRDQFGTTGKWYLGHPWHVEMAPVGKATSKCSLTVQEFPTPIYVYPSYPDGNAVLLAPETGPGEQASIVSTAQGIATVTFSQSATHRLRTDMPGRGGVKDQFANVGKWYLGSSTHLGFTSVGKGKWADVYMGAPWRVESVSNGVAKFNYNYLGSPWQVASTSAGRAAFTRNNVSGAVYIAVVFRGYGGTRDQFGTTGKWYLGSTTRMAAASAGRAGCTNNYVGSRVYLSTQPAAGRSTMIFYLGSPFHVFSTAAGKGGGILYMGSRVFMAGTSPGRAGGYSYLSSPIRVGATESTTSRGRAGGTWVQGGTLVIPNTVSRGVSTMILGPKFLYAHIMAGVGVMQDTYASTAMHLRLTTRGVGSFRENTVLLGTVFRGSAAGTEFDKPPFALVIHAGARYYTRSYRVGNATAYSGGTGYSHNNVGVWAYLSTPVPFANDDPNRSHIYTFGHQPTPSRMAGRASMSFPYEMVAKADAGCRVYDGHVADAHFVLPDRSNWERHDRGQHNHRTGYTGPEGVRFDQYGVVYLTSTTYQTNDWARYLTWYMSSKVYYDIVFRGSSTAAFKRVDEADMNGVGGMIPILGASNRLLDFEPMAGVGRWGDPHFLPDVRLLYAKSNGVGGGYSRIAGPVHFLEGNTVPHGIGVMSIDPGFMLPLRINGIGRMLPIVPPASTIQMSVGRGEWYYERHYPLIAPLLIPNGINGFAYVEITPDTMHPMHDHYDGKSTAVLVQEGIQRPLTWNRCVAGSYPWSDYTDQQNPYATISRTPERPGIDFSGRGHTYHPQGVEIAFAPFVRDWLSVGIGQMTAWATAIYSRRWHTWSDGGFITPFPEEGPPYDIRTRHNDGRVTFTRRAGAIGHWYFRPEPKFASFMRGRGDIRIRAHVTVKWALDWDAHGIAVVTTVLNPGEVLQDLYGDMLALNFSVDPQEYGQGWPRRFRMSGLPV